MNSPTAEITIRLAYADDDMALVRLAALDSALAVPPAPLLLAEVDGEPRAALSLRDGSAVADPFTYTTEVLELLRRRAEHLRGPARRARLGRGAVLRRRRLPVDGVS